MEGAIPTKDDGAYGAMGEDRGGAIRLADHVRPWHLTPSPPSRSAPALLTEALQQRPRIRRAPWALARFSIRRA